MPKTADDTSNLISVKKLATDSGASDALIKKLIKDFEIETTKVKNRTHLDASSVDTIKQILQLKANGKKTKEIKTMFEESQGAKAKPAAKTEKADKKPAKKDSKKTEKADKKAEKTDKKSTKKDSKKEEKADKKAEKADKKSAKKDSKKDLKKSKSKKAKEDEDLDLEVSLEEEQTEESSKDPDYSKEIDLRDYAEEELESHEDPVEEALSISEEEELEEIDDEDSDDAEKAIIDVSGEDTKTGQPRRRRFNFRYVQRQIVHDTRRVDYLKYKLRKPNLTPLERIHFEQALEHRSQLLNGWIHLLRWIKSS